MTKVKLEPLGPIEGKKKISSIKALRILNLITDTIKNVRILGSIHNIVKIYRAKNLETNRSFFDTKIAIDVENEFIGALEKYVEASLQIDEFMNNPQKDVERFKHVVFVEHLYAFDEDSSMRSKVEKIPQMFLDLKETTGEIWRLLNRYPQIYTSIDLMVSEVGWDCDEKSTEIIESLEVLKKYMEERFATTPAEDRDQTDLLKELQNKELQNDKTIKQLEANLAKAMNYRKDEISKRNAEITRLQNNLQQIERNSTEMVRRLKLEAESQEATDNKNSEARRLKLQEELSKLKGTFKQVRTENRIEEEKLRKEKWKEENSLEDWLRKFDKDMNEKQGNLDELEAAYEEEKKQLVLLEERFQPLEQEYEKILKDIERRENKRLLDLANLEERIAAAVKIQRWVRRLKRMGLFGKKKKKKKKKGKKGKKGKKK
ncbi:hypothetical protein SNEBB_011496 [Seison nebaliae]|nr:hypothetical protein SNEBB_011496 [Seison nebaliae]